MDAGLLDLGLSHGISSAQKRHPFYFENVVKLVHFEDQSVISAQALFVMR
jgi:hypothetical protein